MKRFKMILLSIGVMTLVSAALLAIISLVISKMGTFPKGAVPILTTISSCIAVFLGGFISSKFGREKGILYGAASGLMFLIICGTVSQLVYQVEFGMESVAKIAAIMLSGCIGGILGVNGKSKIKF